MTDIGKIMGFLKEAGRLKETYRFSEAEALKEKESSAAHSWRLSLMAILVAKELRLEIDMEKALKIAIVHDVGEAIAGDVDYRLIHEGKITKEEKHAAELAAIHKLEHMLPESLGAEIYTLWKEYEEHATREARFIKALDKLETLSYVIENGYQCMDVPEMIATYADKPVSEFPELIPVLREIKARLKAEFEKGGYDWKDSYESISPSTV